MAIRLLQQTETAVSHLQLNTSTSGHSCDNQSAAKTVTEKTPRRKRHTPGSPSPSLSSPAKKHCSSSSRAGEYVSSLKATSHPAVQAPREYIVLGKR